MTQKSMLELALEMLKSIKIEGSCSYNGIASVTNLTPNSVRLRVMALVQKKYAKVERYMAPNTNGGAHKVVRVILTEKGEAFCKEAANAAAAVVPPPLPEHATATIKSIRRSSKRVESSEPAKALATAAPEPNVFAQAFEHPLTLSFQAKLSATNSYYAAALKQLANAVNNPTATKMIEEICAYAP